MLRVRLTLCVLALFAGHVCFVEAAMPTCTTCTTAGSTLGGTGCCTYTRGFWRNKGYRDGWPTCSYMYRFAPTKIEADANMPDAWSAYTYHSILEENNAGGNICNQLAAQFLTAKLNTCNGACTDEAVKSALIKAEQYLFNKNCPSHFSVIEKIEMDEIKNVLDSYNNGFEHGPGKCGSELDECGEVPCVGGCTRTQGFYKTHNRDTGGKGGKGKKSQTDSSWNGAYTCPDLVQNDIHGNPMNIEDNVLFGTMTWLDVLYASAKDGDACIIAGKQYIAAMLNLDCEKSPTQGKACKPDDVEEALVEVRKLFTDYCNTPYRLTSQAVLEHPSLDLRQFRSAMLLYGHTLDGFNNGWLMGPGTCDALELAVESDTASVVTNDDIYSKVDSIFIMMIITLSLAAWTCCCASLCTKGGSKIVSRFVGRKAYKALERDDTDETNMADMPKRRSSRYSSGRA